MDKPGHWQNSTPAMRWGIVLFLFTAFLYFAGLEAKSLYGVRETRNAGIAAELTFSRYWTVPRLNGDYYTDTPPLHYWITGASMSLLGRTAVAARLPAALFGLCAVMGIFLLGRRLNFSPWICFVGGVSLATTFHCFSLSRGCFPDSLQMALFIWAIYGYYAMLHSERLRRRIHWFIFYAVMMMLLGLAAGFWPLIAVAVMLSGWLAVRGLVCGKRANIWCAAAVAGGTILSCLLALVWLLSVEKLGLEAADGWRNFFAFRPHPAMNLTHIVSFYSPWGILALIGIILSALEINREPVAGERYLLLFVMLLVSLIFGIPGAAYAAAGLLVMAGLERMAASPDARRVFQSHRLRVGVLVLCWAIVLLTLLLAALSFAIYPLDNAAFAWRLILAPFAALCAAVFLLLRDLRKWAILPAIAGMLLFFDTYVHPSAMDTMFNAAAQRLEQNPDAEVYLYRTFDEELRGGVPYYLGRRAMILSDEAALKLLRSRHTRFLVFAQEPPPGCQQLSVITERNSQFGLYQNQIEP